MQLTSTVKKIIIQYVYCNNVSIYKKKEERIRDFYLLYGAASEFFQI